MSEFFKPVDSLPRPAFRSRYTLVVEEFYESGLSTTSQ